MATDLGRKKVVSTAEYESRVECQLSRAEKRIRNLDLTAALLTFAAGTMAYAVVAALLDRWLTLSPGVRQAALVVYLIAAAAYLIAFVILPLSRRINPYFAARQLERTLPDAKNSVVNWLDLREQNLPPAIRGAVGQRAARAVAGTDPDRAVSGRRAWTAGGLTAVCGVAFLVALLTVGFGSFFGQLGRIFGPFGAFAAGGPAAATQIRIVKPASGDAVVQPDQAVEFLVRVEGRTPDPKADDAPKLLFRYRHDAAFQQRALERADGDRWGVSLPAIDVKDGFWYKATGGDAETPEYRVLLTPRLLDFQAVYTFRPYTARAKETHTERQIEAWRGTQVDVTVHANRDIKDGWLQFETGVNTMNVHGDALPGDPQGFTVRLRLDESSQYRIGFTSAEGETFTEAQSFPLIARPDEPPVVTLAKPDEQDKEKKPGWIPDLREDELLQLEGHITDDIGVAAARLNLKAARMAKDEKGKDKPPAEEDYRPLPPQEYRSRDAFKLPHGGNPTTVDYKDFVDVAKLQLRKDGDAVLEYWLTAEDACDYPDPKKPNVGEGKHYFVKIVAPLNNPQAQQQQQRAKAEGDKKESEQKQDQQFKNEDQKRQDDNKKNEQGNKAGGDGSGEHKNDSNAQPKPGMGEDKPGDKPQDGGKPNPQNQGGNDKGNESKSDQGNKPGDAKQEQKQIDNAVNDIRKGEEGSGKSDAKEHPADAKDGGQKQEQQKPGDAKDGGGKEGAKDAAQPKDGPQNKPGKQHGEGAGKDKGQADPKQPQNGEGKPGGDPQASPDARPGEGKDGSAEENRPASESKDGGKPGDKEQAGDAKPQGGAAADQSAKAENKEGNPPNPMGDAGPAGQAKDKPAPDAKAEPRPGPDGSDMNAPKSQGKGDGKQSSMDDAKPASAKDGGEKSDQKVAAQAKPEDWAGTEPPAASKSKNAGNLDEAFQQLQNDLKSKDPQKREMAEEFLRRYMMNSDDPQVRDRAKKTLEDAGLDPKERSAAEGKPLDDGDQPPQDQQAPPAQGKSGSDKDTPPETKEPPKKDEQPGESKGDGKDPKNPKQPAEPPATPKDRMGGGEPGGRSNDVSQEAKPEKPLQQPAGLLQLYNFWQRVPKDVLKDVLADANQQKVLENAAVKATENLPGAQYGGSLPSTAGKTSDRNAQRPNDDPNNGGRAQPPPGYREPYKEFTKLLSPGGDK